MIGETVLLGTWAAAEASVFFIVPDVGVGLIALRSAGRAPVAWGAATAGGLLGALVLRAAVRAGWDPDPLFRRLPGIRARDPADAQAAVDADPTRAFAVAAVSGEPVKLLVVAATRRRMPGERLAGLVVLNRAPRIAATAAVSAGLGAVARRARIPDWISVGLYLGGWSAFYAWYWLSRAEPLARQEHRPGAPAAPS